MKKLLIVMCALSFIACKKEEAKIDYAVISGTITNIEKGKLTLNSKDRTFKQELKVAEDGTFADTLRIDTGTYILHDGKNRTQIHIETGNEIVANFDAKDFKKSLAISGKGSEITNYLLSKSTTEKEMMGEGTGVYELEEEAYKAKFSEIKTALVNMLASSEGLSDAYKAKEKRNLNYSYLDKLSIYQLYHRHYAKKPEFETSEGFLAELENTAYDNEEDFEFSSSYKNLVTSHYDSATKELTKADSTLAFDLTSLKTISKIPSQSIKNGLLYDMAKYGITYTEDLETFYAAYMAGSTDEDNNKEITESYNKLKVLSKGEPSPKFIDYENFAGGTTSLDNLKGKYVYVDVWATWCGPCRAEIPSLKKVEKQYHDKNIEFVSISIDTEKDYEKWKSMVADEELGGVQLMSDKNWKSDFVEGYMIKGIPRFILIDPSGNIVNANAPRPSESKLVELFDELKI